MKHLLELKDISLRYHDQGSNVEVIRDVSLEVGPGEFVCLIGPSGSGKSTLLRIILGLVKPSRGTVTVADSVGLALVFQNFALFPWLTVEQNIAFGLEMRNCPPGHAASITTHLIHTMGLDGWQDKHPKELSGGMKQRVGIARALAVEPTMLLMDEPFSALDALTAQSLRRETLEVCADRKVTVVMVTHLVDEAVEMADRVVVLCDGRIIEEGTPAEVLDRPKTERMATFLKRVMG